MTGYSTRLRLAVPSDGELHQPTLDFLESCDLGVKRGSSRSYTADISSVPGIQVLFQRAADIPDKVGDGSVDLGIVGLDRFYESHGDAGNALVVIPNLRFGNAKLVMAVPETWVDVNRMADLADLSVEFRQSARELRVATKYPNLVKRFLHRHGVYYFTLVQSTGTLEVAPAMGFADIIGDISASGATLRENRLKTLENGTVFVSQSCLVGNRNTLGTGPNRLNLARLVLERIEARLRAAESYLLTANVQAIDENLLTLRIQEHQVLGKTQGLTISQTQTVDGEACFAVTMVVACDQLQDAIDELRNQGCSTVAVLPTIYMFEAKCDAYERLVLALTK